MEICRKNFNRTIAACITSTLLLLSPAIHAQSPQLNFQVEDANLQLPEGLYLNEVYDIAVTDKGELLLLTRGAHPIARFSPKGSYLESFGKGLFNQVHSIDIGPEGYVWVSDVGSHTVYKLGLGGQVELVLGRQNMDGEFYTEGVPLFNKPADVVVSDNGDIYVADGFGNSRVLKFDREGNYIKSWGVKGEGPSEFNLQHSLAIDADQRLLVADRLNNRIQLFDLSGNYLETWVLPDNPYCMAIDKDGFIYVSLGKAPKILKLDSNGAIVGTFGSEGKGPGQFVMPHGIETGPNNEVYVAEPFNWRVERFVVE